MVAIYFEEFKSWIAIALLIVGGGALWIGSLRSDWMIMTVGVIAFCGMGIVLWIIKKENKKLDQGMV